MKELIRRLERLDYSIHSNGYKDDAIKEAIGKLMEVEDLFTKTKEAQKETSNAIEQLKAERKCSWETMNTPMSI